MVIRVSSFYSCHEDIYVKRRKANFSRSSSCVLKSHYAYATREKLAIFIAFFFIAQSNTYSPKRNNAYCKEK
jgi:hypothetical protein